MDAPEPALVEPLRKFWWLRRLTAAGLGLLVLVAGVHLAWGTYGSRVLESEIARLHAAGAPVFAGDLGVPSLTDAENAAVVWNRAAAGLDRSAISRFDLRGPSGPGEWYPAEGWLASRESYQRNQPAIDLARRAAAIPRGNWIIPRAGSLLTGNKSFLLSLFQLEEALLDAAFYLHVLGRDAESLSYVTLALALAEALNEQNDSMCHHQARAIWFRSANTVLAIAPGLSLSEAERRAIGAPAGHEFAWAPAGDSQVRGLIRRLLDESGHRRGLERKLSADRVVLLDTAEPFIRGTSVVRPIYQIEMARALRRLDRLIAVVRAESGSKAVRKAVAIEIPMSARGNPAAPLTSILDGYYSNTFVRGNASLAVRRLAAVSLALQLHRRQAGRWPATLDELVPDFLPLVPLDPTSPDPEATIGYLLADEGRRAVLFVSDQPSGPTSSADPLLSEGAMIHRDDALLGTWGGTRWRDASFRKPVPTTGESGR